MFERLHLDHVNQTSDAKSFHRMSLVISEGQGGLFQRSPCKILTMCSWCVHLHVPVSSSDQPDNRYPKLPPKEKVRSCIVEILES